MNIQEYIASGILETYAMGEATAEERASVEKALAEYSEIVEELTKIEDTLEQLAFSSPIRPRYDVKQKVMSRIFTNKDDADIIPLTPDFPVWRYAAAASVVIALFTSYLAFYYRQQWKETSMALNEIQVQNKQMAEDYNVVNQKLDKIQSDFSIIENNTFTKVIMKGTDNDKNALASVYWNPGTNEVYLSIQQLKKLSQENQFQLWAIVDGKPVDAGVFDASFAGLLKMKNINGAAAFAVTIEPRGGNKSPSLETMQVVGTVANPS